MKFGTTVFLLFVGVVVVLGGGGFLFSENLDIPDLEAANTNLEDENYRLREENSTLTQRAETCEGNALETSNQLAELQTRLSDLETQLATCTERANTCETVRSDLNLEVGQLQAALDDIQGMYQTCNTDYLAAVSEKDASEDSLQSCEVENAVMEVEKVSAVSQHNEDHAKLEELEAVVTAQSEEIERLQNNSPIASLLDLSQGEIPVEYFIIGLVGSASVALAGAYSIKISRKEVIPENHKRESAEGKVWVLMTTSEARRFGRTRR